uniref:Protein PsbN n=1 Tax=Astrosyne radiata TaxID=1158023 RepID=A0A2U9NTC2_9STRA|nr:photosystem II protein N [Astrosyne radiata]AWT40285.1 photosystem II protein N [Astrosyne radiata]
MEPASIIIIFVASLLLGIIIYSLYIAFGPVSQNLRDPFEEHDE